MSKSIDLWNRSLARHMGRHIRRGLAEDGFPFDWTALGSVSASAMSRARVVCKSPGVWAASGLVEAIKSYAEVECLFADGDRIREGQTVARLRGGARAILAIERPFLNLAAYVNGIATSTRRLVDEVRSHWRHRTPPPRVVGTRKTLPYYRDLSIHAIQVGGGHAHRVSLSGGVLIKENHIVAAGGIAKAVIGCRHQAPHGLKIEVEVRNLRELDEAIRVGADGVLLDNFSPDGVREAVRVLKDKPMLVEVSGGIHFGNIAKYAILGVQVISSGSISHSVQSMDLSMLFDA